MNYRYIEESPDLSEQDYVNLHRLAKRHAIQQKNRLEEYLLSYPTANRCLARIHDNTQCTRKYKDYASQLCGSHINSLPYGRIDDPEGQPISDKKIKGRKLKRKSDLDIDQIDLSTYIKTEMIKINGTIYLIDEHGVLFENNDTNMIVGRKLPDQSIEWF